MAQEIISVTFVSSFADTRLCKISAGGLCCETNTSTWRVSFAIWIHQANLLSGDFNLLLLDMLSRCA